MGIEIVLTGTLRMNYLLQPDHVLPLVGILGMKPRDIIDYSMLQFVVHVPLVLFLVRILNHTFRILNYTF